MLVLRILAYVFFSQRISKETKQQATFWKRYRWFLALKFFELFFIWVYSALASELSNIEQEYQWILILLVPILREASIWIVLKVCSKAAEGTLEHKMTVHHVYETRYVVFISIILGSIATPESSYCLIAIDFLTNLYHGLKIVKKSNTGANG